MNASGNDTQPKAPVGARPTFFMFMAPANPKDDYNEVYPGIFIGNVNCAKNKEELKKVGITHLVNCAQGVKFNQINTDATFYKDAGIEYFGIKANDVSTYNMAPNFDKSAEFIEKALANNGKVFVHCHQGISRSATIVLAFLMLKRRMTLMEAVKTVRNKRPIFPNDGFIKQLSILNYALYEPKNL